MLVSDEVGSDVAHANGGITLPGAVDATHNAGLSPLFWNRSGDLMIWQVKPNGRGLIHYSWSPIVGWRADFAYFVGVGSNIDVSASSSDVASFGMSLRCLVSTNNG